MARGFGNASLQALLKQLACFANPPASYRSLSGPPGPKSQKSLKKVSRGLRPWGPKRSVKSLEKVRQVWKKSRKCLFGTFVETFWGPGAGGPGRPFFRLLGISGPEGPRESCSSREGSQCLLTVNKHPHAGLACDRRLHVLRLAVDGGA